MLSEFGEGINLLHALSVQAGHELARTSGIRVGDGAQHFRLILMGQSTNAAWNLVNAITNGYPRIALYLARLLREGHVAAAWATVFNEEARACWEQIDPENPRGKWPTVGAMAKDLEVTFASSQWEKAGDWGKVLRHYGDTHNNVFAHAVSDFSLVTAAIREGDSLRPYLGPTFDQELTRLAIDHSVLLFALLLNDAANLARELRGEMSVSPRAQALGDLAALYVRNHRIPAWTKSDLSSSDLV